MAFTRISEIFLMCTSALCENSIIQHTMKKLFSSLFFLVFMAVAAGAEYLFRKCPIALSLDWHPYVTWQPAIDNKAGFGWLSFHVGVKYAF